MKMYPGMRKMFKSATELDPDDFLAIVKPGTKAKVSATDQFFIYLGWFRDGFTITMISWLLFHTPESPVSRYHMIKFTVFPL